MRMLRLTAARAAARPNRLAGLQRRWFASSSDAGDGGDARRTKLGPGPANTSTKANKYPGAPCWSCEQVFNPDNQMFCNGCNKLQPLMREDNFFELLGLPVSLYVDQEQLERNFQNLQRKVHPGLGTPFSCPRICSKLQTDRYAQRSEKEREFAASRSSLARWEGGGVGEFVCCA
jgi:hypothetical protein